MAASVDVITGKGPKVSGHRAFGSYASWAGPYVSRRY